MTTKPKAKKATTTKKASTPAAGATTQEQTPEPSISPATTSAPAKLGLNDTGREDDAPVLGHFVEVTKGDDKGFFGVFKEVQEGDTAVVRGHANPLQTVSVPLADLKASDLYRR